MPPEAPAVPTVCLRFRFPEQTKVRRLMEACGSILQQVVDYALDNPKTATFSIIQALYGSCRARYPDFPSAWVQSAVRAGAAVVHSFRSPTTQGTTGRVCRYLDLSVLPPPRNLQHVPFLGPPQGLGYRGEDRPPGDPIQPRPSPKRTPSPYGR